MKKVEAVIAKVLGIDESSITNKTSPDNTPEWDSFNGLLLATELEKTYNVKFTIEEVIAVHDVNDIKEALKKHGVNL